MKKQLYLFLFLIVLFSGCNWFRYKPEVAEVLSGHFKNKLYKQFDTAGYNPVFEATFKEMQKDLKNPMLIKKWYNENNGEPLLITRFYANGGLDSLKNFVSRINTHGLDPEAFYFTPLKNAMAKLDNSRFKTIEQVYPVIAALELTAANAYLTYHNALTYGCINPKNFLSRYNIKNERPDSNSIAAALDTKDLYKQLIKDQPVNEQYKLLQQAYAAPQYADMKELIAVNMERLRWKQPDMGNNYVFVNLPDFSLTWFNGRDTLTYMKVCVGAKREAEYEEKIKTWLKTRKLEDQPKNHETPMLVSKFNSIQVNPVWNIPASIGKSEIYFLVLKDPYYLSNNNIKVYYKDKLVANPDTIQWSRYSRDKLPFSFKQGAGDGNALGKFKFVFESSSSIYLHDTNNKGGFSLKNRAISHGCIRIEKPLVFAEKLLNDKYAYDQLRMEVNLPPIDTSKMQKYKKLLSKRADTVKKFVLSSKWFSVKQDVPLIITYFTAWVQNGKLEYRPDIYGQDPVLINGMKKYSAIR